MDIGLNFVCFVIYEWKVCMLIMLFNEKMFVGLGCGIVVIGWLVEMLVEVVFGEFVCFWVLIWYIDCKDIFIVVMVVVCDVENGLEFVCEVEVILGVLVCIFDGNEEVFYFVLGVIVGFW